MKRLTLFLLITVIFLSGCGQNIKIAFTVNDLSVEKDELILYMEQLSDSTAFEIEQKYGIIYEGEDFWKAEADGKTTAEILKQAAADELIRIKITMLEAEKYGISIEKQYSEQLKDWKADNAKRKQDEAAGEIVYGTTERTFYTYSNLCFLECEKKLKQKLDEKGIITVSENEKKQYYSAHPDWFADEGKSYEDTEVSIYSWIFMEKYETYIEKLISKANINYLDMDIDTRFLK